MYTRSLEFTIKPEKTNDFLSFTRNEIVPILKKQPGFVELLPFIAETGKDRKVVSFTLWTNKTDADRYEREWYPKVAEMLKPYLTSTPHVHYFNFETTLLCKEFAHSIAA